METAGRRAGKVTNGQAQPIQGGTETRLGDPQLYINKKLVGEPEYSHTVPLLLSLGEGLVVGRDPGTAVSSLYQSPFEFTGDIRMVTADVSGKLIQDTQEEEKTYARVAIARQ